MYLTRRINKTFFEHVRSKSRKRLWILIVLVSTFAVCDVLVLFILFKVMLPKLLYATPFLLHEHNQEYTHLATFSTPRTSLTTLAFSPDGKTLACGAYDQIVLWDLETGNKFYSVNAFRNFVTDIVFSPDGDIFAGSSRSNQSPVILFDTATGQVKTSLSGHKAWITHLDFSPKGNTVIGASHNGSVTAWDTNTGMVLQRIPGTFAFARRTSFRRVSSTYSHLNSIEGHFLTRWNWDIRSANFGNTQESLMSILNSKAFEDDGIIAMAPGPRLLPIYLSSHSYPIQALAFSADGKTLASSSRSDFQPFNITTGKIHLWDVETGMPMVTLRTPGRRVDTLAFSPNGNYLACDGSKRWLGSQKIFIWDLTTYELITMIDTDSSAEITALVFSADNKTLASGSKNGIIHLWDIIGETTPAWFPVRL